VKARTDRPGGISRPHEEDIAAVEAEPRECHRDVVGRQPDVRSRCHADEVLTGVAAMRMEGDAGRVVDARRD
jgi:hypothetical protein